MPSELKPANRAGCLRWNIVVLGVTLLITAVAAGVNYRINIYGVFGDTAGKKLVVYDNERTTKYLFSYNYIPGNFDGLLVGTSISDNWDTSHIAGMRVYNASINGGNISEEDLLLSNVLRRGHPRLIMFVIHPYLTESSGRKSGYMNPQEYWGALGSIQLLRVYWNKFLIEHRGHRQEFNDFGQDDYEVHQTPAALQELLNAGQALPIDPAALKEYGELLERARASGARVVGVIPPVSTSLWERQHEAYAAYYKQIRSLFRPDEPIIDFNAGEFNHLRSQAVNFPDGVHLSRAAADRVVDALNGKLEGVLAAR
ncbi:MAG: hypothetical protein ACRD4F_01915 [Candidatus Angelobacter sp.]